ncbi:MAG: hypothetical protein J6X16_01335 [Bacteroidales bacterium]|nr:hypothetical protein [Bacteroidales bacterium]
MVNEVLSLYKHLGEMRQSMQDGGMMSHISDMLYTHSPGSHHTARLRRLYGVNCA